MFQQLAIHGWVIEIDKEATTKANESAPVVWPDNCACNDCQNFVAAAPLLTVEFTQICSALGVNPLKPVEVYEQGKMKDGLHLYGGWFHLVGRLISEPLAATSVTAKSISINFTEEAALVPDGFPTPILQVNFSLLVPWVLAQNLENTMDVWSD